MKQVVLIREVFRGRVGEEQLWGEQLQRPSMSKQDRFDPVVTGMPSSMSDGLRHRHMLYSDPPFCSVTMVSAADKLLCAGEALHCHRGRWLM